MTRDQAIEAAATRLEQEWRNPQETQVARIFDPEKREARDLVVMLEALGLLKFDDPHAVVERHVRQVLGNIILGPRGADGFQQGWQIGPGEQGADLIVLALKSAGYAIVRHTRPR